MNGVSDPSIFCAAYAGIAPERAQGTGFSVFVAASSIGQSVQFILSENVTHEVNLYVILTLSALAVPLFSTADHHFGSGRSRHCCRRKQAVKTSDQFGHDSNLKGMTHDMNIISFFCPLAWNTGPEFECAEENIKCHASGGCHCLRN